MFIWLLETLQRYNVFGVVSFLLPFVLFCYHAFLLKRNKTEKKERARPVDAEPEETAENHSSSSSNEEEDDDENDEKTVDLTKKNCYDAPNLIYQENHERNSEIRKLLFVFHFILIFFFFNEKMFGLNRYRRLSRGILRDRRCFGCCALFRR